MYTPEQAEILAIQALGYLADVHEELHRMMTATGMDIEAIKHSTQSREGLAGLLDYISQKNRFFWDFAKRSEFSLTNQCRRCMHYKSNLIQESPEAP